jgi:hypothetical protein
MTHAGRAAEEGTEKKRAWRDHRQVITKEAEAVAWVSGIAAEMV